MTESRNGNFLSPDKALSNPKDDVLGYATFAEHLAESLYRMAPAEGFVVAIHGQWGSGKTTLLNFIEHSLKQRPENEQPIIVHFNPWWFSGHEDLTRQFFSQLQAVLSEKRFGAEEIAEQIAKYARVVSKIPLPFTAVAGEAVSEILEAMQKDVPELKSKLAKALREKGKRILVIIDDADRLTAEEIRQLFRTVKAIADFPNIIYLLAFDKDVAIKALASDNQGLSGEDYLGKIIQLPVELPIPEEAALRGLFFGKLESVLAGTPEGLFEKTYWGNVYHDGIDYFINTPRDIIRLINSLMVTYPAVAGEVNPVDFIAMEALRVFCPVVYEVVRKNPDSFCGHREDRESDAMKQFHNTWIEDIAEKDREPVKGLLMRLFPKLERIWRTYSYGSSFEAEWRKKLRVCSEDIFPVYFRLAVPEGNISHTEMRAILSLTENEEAFSAKLLELAGQKRPDGTTRARAFLEMLEDYTAEIPLEQALSILQVFFDIGDELLRSEDERAGILEFGNDIKIGRYFFKLMRRIDGSNRLDALKKAIGNGKAISIIVGEIVSLGQQHGKYGANQIKPDDERLISLEELQQLEGMALQKVRESAQNGSLTRAPNLAHILARWRDWAGEEEVREWVQQVIGSNEGLLQLLEKFLTKTFSISSTDVVQREWYRLDPEWLEPYLEPDDIIERVRQLSESGDLTERQRIACEQFVEEYEMRQRGINPDSPSAWER